MKKIYLHMGFHKTATSSFQATCANNLKLLAKQNILYPGFRTRQIRNGDAVYNHSAVVKTLFGRAPEHFHINVKANVSDISSVEKDYQSTLDMALNQDMNILLSGEGISQLPEDCLIKFKDYLESEHTELIPFICIRSPYSNHCSSIQSIVNQGGHTSLTAFSSQRQKILRLKNVFGPALQIAAFDEACKHDKGPVGFLFDLFGVDHADFSFAVRNESRSNEFTRLQNVLNQHEPLIVNNSLNPGHVSVPKVAGQKFLLTKEEYNVIAKDVNAENAFFKTVLGEEYCDKKIATVTPFGIEELVEAYPRYFFNKSLSAKPASLMQKLKKKLRL